MTITQDLYKELELDRSWDEKTIRDKLKDMQKLWIRRQGSCNDKNQLLQIDQVLNLITDGYHYLTKAAKRKKYDKALDEAYQGGAIQDKVEEELHSILDQARAYYRNGNLQMAAQKAEELISQEINDPAAYDLLARCYYETDRSEQALEVIDRGIQIFDNIKLHWLGARMATNGTKNYDDAQRRINVILEKNPEDPMGNSEQIFLHLNKGEEDLAFQEIDTYLEAHPDNNDFRKCVAYDINAYSNTCYYFDEKFEAYFFKDDASCARCLKLRTKSESIFSDEVTQKDLQNAQFLSEKGWNDWYSETITSLLFTSLLLCVLYFPVGLLLLALTAGVWYQNYVPNWKMQKAWITHDPSAVTTDIGSLGDYALIFAKKFLKFVLFIYRMMINALLWFVGYLWNH